MANPDNSQVSRSTSFAFAQISQEAIIHLKALDYSHTGTRRLCLHDSHDSQLHMMLIEIQPQISFSRHRHSHSDEVVFLLQGSLEYELSNGTVHILSEKSSRSIIIPMNCLHSVKSGQNGALYLEVISGPFTKKQPD